MIHSLRTATDAAEKRRGRLHFPEGQMTRIGQMLPFRRGIERIIKAWTSDYPRETWMASWGLDFQFCGRAFPLEISPAHSLSGARNVGKPMPRLPLP